MEQLSNLVGPTIRRLRDQRVLTQKMLAIRLQLAGLDVTRGWLSKVEAQLINVTDKQLVYIARVLQVQVSDLFPKIDPDRKVHDAVTALTCE